VEPLHLDIEKGVRIYDDVGSLLDEAGQNPLVIGFEGLPLTLKVDVTGQRLQARELVFQIRYPSVTDVPSDGQHLNVLFLVTLYNRLRRGADAAATPRTVIFGGKAGSRIPHGQADHQADQLRRTDHQPGPTRLPGSQGGVPAGLQRKKRRHRVYPAADLSEQISTAGKEASGTGNMKFVMNGAITIGTLDGANIEIRDAVGHENFFLFGLTAEEVERLKVEGYAPRSIYESNPELREALDLISSGFFSNGDRALFHPLVESLLTRDDYMLLADYQAYVECQQRVSQAYADQNAWTRMSILNTARVGHFSSDRSIREYCRDIWKVTPIVPDERRA
jgi:glycogen phosphorylase